MKKVAAALLCACGFIYAADYDPIRGEMLSLSCSSCHGTDGKSHTVTPYIAGMGKTTLFKILMEYKTGDRKATMMQKHVAGFTEEELEQVAYYFSKVPRD